MTLPLVALALILSMQDSPAPKEGVCGLPKALAEALQQRFGSSRVLNSADLFEDERSLFRKEHPGACPGIARGQFFGPKERPALAIVLLDVEPKKNLRVVVARPALATWTFFEVDELDQGSTPVAGTRGAGTYTDSSLAITRNSTHDVVALTGYETWQRVYVWNGRSFERLQLTR